MSGRLLMMVGVVAGLLGACGSTSPALPSPSLSPTPSASASPPTGFVCAGASGGSQQASAHILAVRVEQQPGFDRMTIEFDAAVPAYSVVRQGGTLFTESPKGTTVTLDGTSGILITIQHIADWTSYAGPMSFKPQYASLREARLIQNFEAVQQWALGVQGYPCLRVSTPSSPTSLVVDIATS